MKNKKNRTLVLLLTILTSLFVLHFSQHRFKWVELQPLHGYYAESKKTKFTWERWFSGEYQEKRDDYLTNHFGFRNFLVRVNNQLRFSLFDKIKPKHVLMGKDFYLYESHYIGSWYGDDFVGQEVIESKSYKLKLIQDTLNQMGKKIIAVLAPGKGSFYPEYIPDKYHKERGTANIDVYRQYIEKWNINCIDFDRYFIENKYTSPYPLFPQLGIHWSYYGMCIAADSILRYIEKMNNIEMPRFYWENIKLSQPLFEDDDIFRAMNLLFQYRTFDMAYPELRLELDADSTKSKPSLMVVADSFYWGIYNMGWSNLFTDDHFWYYNKTIYPEDTYMHPYTTEDIDMQEEIMKHDIIIILCTHGNMHSFGWGFIENCYDALYSPDEN